MANKIFLKDNVGNVSIPSPVKGQALVYGDFNWVSNELLFPVGTLPTLTDFSWVNQSDSTVTTHSRGLFMTSGPSYPDNIRALVKSKTGIYSVTALVNIAISIENYQGGGLVWRQSSNGYLQTFGPWLGNLGSHKFTGPTSGGTQYYVKSGLYNNRWIWLRLSVGETNRICSYSFNGVDFITAFSVPKADFMTPDQVGFYVNPCNASYGSYLYMLSWKEE